MVDTISNSSHCKVFRDSSGLWEPARHYDEYIVHWYQLEMGVVPPEYDATESTPVKPLVNYDRWLWRCDRGGVDNYGLDRGVLRTPCPTHGGWHDIDWHPDTDAVEAEMARHPRVYTRHWKPHWTLDELRARTARVLEVYERTGVPPTSMSITTPHRYAVGESLSASNMNINVDAIEDVSGDNGVIEFRAPLRIEPGAALPTLEGEIAYLSAGKKLVIDQNVSGASQTSRIPTLRDSTIADGCLLVADSNDERGFRVILPGAAGQTLTMGSDGFPAWQ